MKTLFLLLVLSLLSQSQDMRIWQKHGVTSTEWMIARDSGVSIKKLDKLTLMGVSVRVYVAKPWIAFNIKERWWWSFKGMGLSDEEIETLSSHRRYRYKKPSKKTKTHNRGGKE